MNKIIKHTLTVLICSAIVLACKNEPEPSLDAQNKISPLRGNPFSVESMVRAKRVIENSAHYAAAGSPSLNPRVTHYYVVFSPANNEELDMIVQSGDVELFDRPLDVSFLGEGSAIFDYDLATLAEDSPGHQFTTVTKDFSFPPVPYQIIAEIYLPFEDPELFANQDRRGSIPTDGLPCDLYKMAQEWENQSLTDNGYADFVDVGECEPYLDGGSGGGGSTNPYPSNQWGRIRIFDNSPGVNRLIPIEGVRVTTTRFLSWKRSHTNAEGYYKVNSPHHEKESKYEIKWEDDDFRIIAHSGGQATLEGPDQKGPWNFDIANNTKAQWYGTAFSAAKQYYDGERYGLAKPQNGDLFRTTIKVRDNDCTSRYAPHADIPVVGALFFNDIKVCVADYKDNMSALYGTTVHELTHSAHFKERPGNFSEEIILRPAGRRVLESWAQGVEWWFTINKYRTLSNNMAWGTYGGYSSHFANFQYVTIDNSRRYSNGAVIRDDIYTSLVIDLIDDFNQRDAVGTDLSRPLDRVSGYTINQIESALYNNSGVALFSNWKHNLLNMFDNPTESFLHEYFNNWDQLD